MRLRSARLVPPSPVCPVLSPPRGNVAVVLPAEETAGRGVVGGVVGGVEGRSTGAGLRGRGLPAVPAPNEASGERGSSDARLVRTEEQLARAQARIRFLESEVEHVLGLYTSLRGFVLGPGDCRNDP